MSEIEAAGAAATAGLVAGAIERKGGAGESVVGSACLNCGATLAGAYCQACGQPAKISRTLGDVLGDFLHAFLHFDTKAWRTLPQLVVRPGTMTHAYIHGQRAKYVSPLAMFLFSIFLMFLVIQSVAGPGFLDDDAARGPVVQRVLDVPAAEEKVRAAQAAHDLALADLEKARAAAEVVRASDEPGAGGEATGILAGPEAEARVKADALRRAKARLELAQRAEVEREKAAAVKDAAPASAPVVVAVDAKADAEKSEVNPAVDINLSKGTVSVKGEGEDGEESRTSWRDELREEVESGEFNVKTGWAALDRGILAAARNPDLAIYKLQETASKFSFLLVPISLPFIALLFIWKRGVTLFDHVVFSLYSLSFMSLLFIVLGLASQAGPWTTPIIASAGTFLPPVHMFFHLGGTYGLGWWSALWRTVFLLFFIIFVTVIFAVSIALLGVLS